MSDTDRYAALRAALARDYHIEQVLREDSLGAAYVARDTTLQRRVLVKAVDPTGAGEDAAAEFTREVRALATLADPSIPAVHHAGTVGDQQFVVLESPEGPTLAERLKEGPLDPAEVRRLGLQLVGALESVHGAGFAHTDIRSATVIVGDARYLLDGFRAATEASGEAVLRDLRAVGALLGESSGGTLPRAFRRAVEQSLDPARGRPTARRFRQALSALEPPRSIPRSHSLIAAGAALTLGVLYLPRLWRPDPPPAVPSELAVLPLEVDGSQPLDPLGSSFAHLIQLGLEEVPGLELTPRGQVDRWWDAQAREGSVDGFSASRALRARWVAHGTVDRRTDRGLRVRLVLYDSAGTSRALPEVRGSSDDLAAMSDSIALGIIRIVAPRAEWRHDPAGGFAGVPLPALKAFLRGEAAFSRDAWATAQGQYEIAVEIDSTFALADWRLANVRRWRRLPYGSELAAVYRRHASRLRARDRLLIEALLQPDLDTRLAALDGAVRRLPTDGYARLLQGEELFHHGPLAGRELDEALQVMDDAIARDSSLALAYDHLVIGHVRAGRRKEAMRALGLRQRLGGGGREEDLDLLPFLELVYDERFVPWRAWARYRYIAWRRDARDLADIEQVVRMGTPWFDLPHTQLRYSDLLLRAGPANLEVHTTAHQGKGLALAALGRVEEALAEIDTVALLLDSPESQLQRAQWRAVWSALGISGIATGEWEPRLAGMVDDTALSRRAAWTLALLAGEDTAAARAWGERLRDGDPLRILCDARLAALRGDRAAALAMTEPIRRALEPGRSPDPFAGAVLRLLRGEWLAASGDPAGAARELLWYEATDTKGWPTGLPQPGEVDAALGTLARLHRARALLAVGTGPDSLKACRHLGRLRELWSDASPGYRPMVSEALALAESCRP